MVGNGDTALGMGKDSFLLGFLRYRDLIIFHMIFLTFALHYVILCGIIYLALILNE